MVFLATLCPAPGGQNCHGLYMMEARVLSLGPKSLRGHCGYSKGVIAPCA